MDTTDEPLVELMGEGGAIDAWSLSSLYNPATDEYTVPTPNEAYRPLLRSLYLRQPGTTGERFDAAWPMLWRLTDTLYDSSMGRVAIIDSGVLTNHPLLKDCIAQTIDFTGEGVEDRAGHGTLTTLIARMVMTGVPKDMFVIVKCVGADGRGTQENFMKALEWCRDYNKRSAIKITSANLSLGVYNKRMGLLDCDGTCKLCRLAVDVSAEITLTVAAGNIAGKTACPARAAFLPSKPHIIAVSRPEEKTSGKGTVGMNLEFGKPTEMLTLRRIAPDGEHA